MVLGIGFIKEPRGGHHEVVCQTLWNDGMDGIRGNNIYLYLQHTSAKPLDSSRDGLTINVFVV